MKQDNTNKYPKMKPEDSRKSNSETRIKVFIQMLEIKKDTGMTRIYSAIKSYKTT